MPYSTGDIFLFIIGFFLPPIPVFIKRGFSADLLINIALWCLGAGKFHPLLMPRKKRSTILIPLLLLYIEQSLALSTPGTLSTSTMIIRKISTKMV